MISPEEIDDEQAARVMAAMRFAVAVLNGDSAQALALFRAPVTAAEASRVPLGLVTLVGTAGRARLAEEGSNG